MNLNDIQKNTFAFIWKYRWFVIPGIFFVLLFVVIFVNQLTERAQQPSQRQQLTPTPQTTNSDGSIPNGAQGEGTDTEPQVNINPYTDPQTLLKKEIRQTSVVYTEKSPLEGHPNMTILSKDEKKTLFTRSVSDPATPISLSEYLQAYGQPEYILPGSLYFGQAAQLYLYADQGLAFIGNPQTNQVLEVQTFGDMSPDQYITDYGNDIPPASKQVVLSATPAVLE